MRAAFKDDPDITVISQHDSCIFAFTSKNNSFHGMAICDVMKKERKWERNPKEVDPMTCIAIFY